MKIYEAETPKVAAAVVPLRYQAATIIAKTLGGAKISGPMLDYRVAGGTPEAMVNFALRQYLRSPHSVESWHEAGKMLQLARQMKILWDETLLRPAHKKVMELDTLAEEERDQATDATIQQFVEFVARELKMTAPKHVKIVDDPDMIKEMAGKDSFGLYDTQTQTVTVFRGQRHPADILRTLAHEMVHHKQLLKQRSMDGRDGSSIENEANALAGVLMRKFTATAPTLMRQTMIESKRFNEVLGPENEWGTKELVAKYKKATPGQIPETIKKIGNKYRLVSKKTGKNLGTYSTKAGAEKRERQVQFFKHQHEDIDIGNPETSSGATEPGAVKVKMVQITQFPSAMKSDPSVQPPPPSAAAQTVKCSPPTSIIEQMIGDLFITK